MHLRRITFLTLLIFCLLLTVQPQKADAKTFKNDVEAPSWGDTQWINLPKGKKSLDVDDYKGKIVYLYFFQKW